MFPSSLHRRFVSFLIGAIALVSIALPGAALAQGAGSTVTVNLVTCTVTGSVSTARMGTTQNPTGVGRDCVDGWPEGSSLLLDGMAPDNETATSVTWHNVADGEHEFTGSGFATLADDTIVIEGEDATLWATFQKHQRGPEYDANGNIIALPNTGTGVQDTTTGAIWALAAAAGIAGIGACMTRRKAS